MASSQSLPDSAGQNPPMMLQSCSDSCAGFRSLGKPGWPDYGLCENPLSPFKGAPVRIGRECAYALPRIGDREA